MEKNIYQRMHGAMLAVKYVQKGDKTVNNQYRFVSHDAVIAAVRPALLDNGIVTVVSVTGHTQDGNRTEAQVRVRFVNVDKPNDFIEVDSFGYGIDPQDKGPGKAVSYATKYCLLKTLCLETGDDPERDQIAHVSEQDKLMKVVEDCAIAAQRLHAKGDEIGAFGEVYDIVMSNEHSEEKLYLWNLLKTNSALRSSLKKQAANERKMAELPVTLAEQG